MGDLTLPLMIAAAVLLLLVFIRIIRLPLTWNGNAFTIGLGE